MEEAFAHVKLGWRDYVEIDPKYFRPTELDFLWGDAGKAKSILVWQPRVSFQELVRIMVDADLQALMDMLQCQDVIERLRPENHLGPRAAAVLLASRGRPRMEREAKIYVAGHQGLGGAPSGGAWKRPGFVIWWGKASRP